MFSQSNFTVWLILLFTGIKAMITQGPSNAVVEIKTAITLNCFADATINNWVLTSNGITRDGLTIVGPDTNCSTVNSPYGDHYAVESSDGGKICNLIVFDITKNEAGVYKCTEGTETRASILTVIDPPNLKVGVMDAVEGESVIIECMLGYNGSFWPAPSLLPYFYWRDNAGRNVSSSYDFTENTMASSQMIIIAGREDIMPHTCHVYAQLSPPETANYDKTIPEVNSSTSSPTVEVFYNPSRIEFLDNYQVIAIGETTCDLVVNATCLSSGNPVPSFEWFDMKENVSISNQQWLDLAEINRPYRCVAHNTIRKEVHYESSFYLPRNKSGIPYCRFPRDESMSIFATPEDGCGNGMCVCSIGQHGFHFLCGSDSYPGATYQWIGPNNKSLDSEVYDNAQENGLYQCSAYFQKSLSNYTGAALFPNGTSRKVVTECYAEVGSDNTDVAISMGVLFGISFAANITVLVIFLYHYYGRTKEGQSERAENALHLDDIDVTNTTPAPHTFEELTV